MSDFDITMKKYFLGNSTASASTSYTLDNYNQKMSEIAQNPQLKDELKNLLISACNQGVDLTLQMIPADSRGRPIYSLGGANSYYDYIYLIPIGQFHNFLNTIGITPNEPCYTKLEELRKTKEAKYNLRKLGVLMSKNITGETTRGGRKTRRHKKSKRSGKSKRRRHRKTRK